MNRNQIEAALAISEKYGVARKQETREDIVAMPRMCAKHGRAWTALYEAKGNGHYRLKDCERVTGAKGASGGTAKQIPLDLIDGRWFRREKCPWCGADNLIHCGMCEAFVCSGRVRGDHFRCTDACGFGAVMAGSYSSFTGTAQSSPTASRGPQSSGSSRTALPPTQRAQLSAGRK
jgi:hypothetical protein